MFLSQYYNDNCLIIQAAAAAERTANKKAELLCNEI